MKEIYRKIKKFIQRGKRGWSDEDTWNFDYYLSEVISGGCKHLANNLHSYPQDPLSKNEKEWKKILNKISKGIMAPIKLDDRELTDEKTELDMKKYRREYKTAYKKQAEALQLFAKWFNNLWD